MIDTLRRILAAILAYQIVELIGMYLKQIKEKENANNRKNNKRK